MASENLRPCVCRILRYAPNLVRDEWLNIGVILMDPARKQARARLIEVPAEMARVRRLHPNADLALLQTLQADFQRQFEAHADNPQAWLDQLDTTLSNVLQLSPQRGVLTADFDSELDRVYQDQVEPPVTYRAEEPNSRLAIRRQMQQVFRSAGVLERCERAVGVAEFTFKGDPLRLDLGYRRNGTAGFVHALSLARDPGQAKVLAFTTERMRTRLPSSEFTAVVESEPQADNERHQFVSGLLAEQQVSLVSLARLPEFANRLRADLQ